MSVWARIWGGRLAPAREGQRGAFELVTGDDPGTGGAFTPGDGVDRTADVAAIVAAPHPDGIVMEPLDGSRWNRVQVQFVLTPDANYSATCYVNPSSGPPDWIDEPDAAFVQTATPLGQAEPNNLGVSVEVLVPPGGVYYFNPTGQGFDFGSGPSGIDGTGVAVQKLVERPL